MAICGIWCKYVDILVYKVKGAKQTEREQDASYKLLQAGDHREAQDLERYHAGSAVGYFREALGDLLKKYATTLRKAAKQ